MLDVVARRRWWVLTAAAVIPVAAIAFLLRMPSAYTSEATLVVVQQRIPDRFVAPLSVRNVSDEIRAIEMEVLSRRRVLEIVEELDLYPGLRDSLAPDDVVELMRGDVGIEPIWGSVRNDVNAFKVTYTSNDPELAQSVVVKLTSLFIEENRRTQGSQRAVTTKFVTDQLEVAKQRLTEQEQRLTNYKMRNLGALPEQQQTNTALLADLRIRMQDVSANLSRTRQQRVYWESLVSGKLGRLQAERNAMLLRLTPKHQDVVKKDGEIAATEELATALRSGRIPPGGLSTAHPVDDPLVLQLQGQLESNFSETEELQRTERSLRAQMAQSQGRLNSAPLKEQELSAIQRDYETYKKEYQDLLANQLNSRMSASLDEQQEGQHYRLVDPPTLPSTPSRPKRKRLSWAAIAGGLLAGLVLAMVRDRFDRSFHSERELRESFQVPLVVGLPLLTTPAEERRKKTGRVFEWIAATALVMVVVAAEFLIIRNG